MAQVLADRRDIDFVLYEQLDMEQLTKTPVYKGMNRKLFDMMITEARNLAIKEILPTNADGDKIGVTFDNGEVLVPESFKKAFDLIREGDWTAMNEDPDLGGQGTPYLINFPTREYLWGGNYCLVNYATMGHGTGKMIEAFGSQKQKDLFLDKLYTAQWGGTMLLTEPEAGSDVGALTTTAVKNEDGTYSISGAKIFITNGEHQLTENIVHPVLARVEGAPEGTKGISIFIVPKYWVNEDGSMGDFNDVVCTGVEEKMGIHGSATCSLTLGGAGKCRGLLLGQECEGMKIMFHMMNDARLNVGFQAFTYASSAYLYACNYAKERIQGKDLTAGKNSPSVTIVNHPDIRRMLTWMKAHVDGMRSFIYYTASLFDWMKAEPDSDQAQNRQDLIDFFIPLVKGYSAQRSFDVCVNAMQVYGGYGYTKEYPIEQLLRDCKITSIYEGTDGIQAMDLLGRKLQMRGGALFQAFANEVNSCITAALEVPELSAMADRLANALACLGETAQSLSKNLATPLIKTSFASAFPFMEATGDVIMAWMLLWRSNIAVKAQEKAKSKDKAYYSGVIKTAEFFIYNVLPVALGKMDAMNEGNGAAIEIPDDCFGG
ncbi:acyl-CoA dehydrogenase [Desulfatibacillum aliphaticivorans]|uniref:acyl-CoA dehydrogenase n=1 Tax=Desulfatibacillum aliphaticivorans TaxID=218208 RepID=UPI0004062FEF|nr:acyl-CoA dehydrogenase [Desulfatibacillum aliphaticivorans]